MSAETSRQVERAEVQDGTRMLEIAAVSDPGPIRQENQDAWCIVPLRGGKGCGLLLADGMGGHASGAEAAWCAVQAAAAFLAESTDPVAVLGQALAGANSAVARHRAASGAFSGTTLVAAVITDGRSSVANVGDSRAYLLRYIPERTITQVTVDHSWAAEAVRVGQLTPAEAATSPQRGLLTRALSGEEVPVDTFPIELEVGDTLLLCCDGLWGSVSPSLLADIFSTPEALARSVERACEAALDAGATDNVTAVACRVHTAHDPTA